MPSPLYKRALLLSKPTSIHFTLGLRRSKTIPCLFKIPSHLSKQALLLSEMPKVCSSTMLLWSGYRRQTSLPSSMIPRRQEGTEQWFLDPPKFKRWLQGSDKALFCPGIPGAGKTMMAAITIDYLCKTALLGVFLGPAICLRPIAD
jgi:hypothetical protein